MLWKGGFNCPRKSLFEKGLAKAIAKHVRLLKAQRGQSKYTYISSDQHLLCEVLYVPLIAFVRSTFAEWEDISQV